MGGILIVGAGQAGAQLAETLRKRGYDGALTLIGAEPEPPYQRPPLSKGYLLGELARERLYLRPERFYADHDITLVTGAEATGLNPAARTLRAGGRQYAYDQLALTTGGVPVCLSATAGGDLARVHTVRSLADIDRLAPAMVAGARLLVVGGGYIGLEAAAVARKRGASVVLVEQAERILARTACAETAAWFAAKHRAEGVDLREGTALAALHGEARVSEATLTDGSTVPVDLVVCGIGIRPDTALAEAAGLKLDNGIAVDAFGRTSDPAIWAAGDCASFPYARGRIRLESVQNAIDQASAVAANMLGAAAPYRPSPWFWSDQYDAKLQIAGLGGGYDRIVVRPGGRAGAVSHWYLAGTTLLAVDAINDPRAYMVGKRLIEAGVSPPPTALADPAADLKALLKGAAA